MTPDELADHSVVIGRALAANDKDAFVAAFSAYCRACIDQDVDPCGKISRFVYILLEGYDVAMVAMAQHRSGGRA
jgi:hypothetical protein